MDGRTEMKIAKCLGVAVLVATRVGVLVGAVVGVGLGDGVAVAAG